jgi:hypothetical protein
MVEADPQLFVPLVYVEVLDVLAHEFFRLGKLYLVDLPLLGFLRNQRLGTKRGLGLGTRWGLGLGRWNNLGRTFD